MTKSFSNQQLAKILRQIGAVKEVTGANRFTIVAYDNAADATEHTGTNLKTLWEKGKLTSIPGIGSNIASHLGELFAKGNSSHFDQIFSKVPAGMLPLLELPGLGPKRAFLLAKQLKLTSAKSALNKLERAAKVGKIAAIKTLGEKIQSEILTSIQSHTSKSPQRIRLDMADSISTEIISYLNKSPAVEKTSPLGSLRRRQSTAGDIDIGLTTTKPDLIVKHLKTYPANQKILAAGSGLVRFIHSSGQQIDVKIAKPNEWGALLQHFTGSKAHNIHLRELALKKGLSLSEHGIKHQGKLKDYSTEEAFYQALQMDWIPPELREDSGEIQAAINHSLPQLIQPKDIKGDFHTHTNHHWISSHDAGINSPKQLINQAIDLNYDYLTLGDHNPSQSSYSKKELVNLVKKRSTKLRKLSSLASENPVKRRSINILISLEIDIHPDGTLVLPNQAAAHLDFIIASVHSSMKMDKDEMTKRVIKAISQPKVKILGHPTGGLINKRPSYQLNWDKVFTACLKHQVALEINAHPSRLDINEHIVRAAIAKNVKLVINTDAHAAAQLKLMGYGVSVARRGWAQPRHIINTWPWPKLKRWIVQT